MKKNRRWTSAADVLEAIYEAHQRLLSGETSVEQASVEVRSLRAAQKVLSLRLQHAQLTGRLKQGSTELPDFQFGDKT